MLKKPYEKLKALTRGQTMTREMMVNFVNGDELTAVPETERQRLADLTPCHLPPVMQHSKPKT